ncbi:MAG: YbaB/EbfC family nucleoid-associated protein [Angustibacter sp.]
MSSISEGWDSVDIDREVAKVMEQVREQNELVEAAQQDLLATEIVGSAERGIVTVRMNGGGRFTGVTIEPYAVQQYRPDRLGPLVLEAIQDAMRQLAQLTQEKFGPLVDDPQMISDAVTYWTPEDSPNHRPDDSSYGYR